MLITQTHHLCSLEGRWMIFPCSRVGEESYSICKHTTLWCPPMSSAFHTVQWKNFLENIYIVTYLSNAHFSARFFLVTFSLWLGTWFVGIPDVLQIFSKNHGGIVQEKFSWICYFLGIRGISISDLEGRVLLAFLCQRMKRATEVHHAL